MTKLTVPNLYEQLGERLGAEMLSKRLMAQTHLSAKLLSARTSWFNADNLYGLNSLLKGGLWLSGLQRMGNRSFLDVQIFHNEVYLESLPRNFDGLTVLQLTDLHLDGDFALTDSILQRLETVGPVDMCAITGDFRFHIHGSIEASMKELARITEAISVPSFAVLGNHDDIEMVPYIEEAGARVLLNESVTFQREDESLHLVGIDDPHFYQTHDLEKALHGVPGGECKFLLSHSPESYEVAEQHGIDFLVCGHTHGGQVCLPGGLPLLLNARCPREYGRGSWRHGKLQGYTSRGTGGSGVAVRFNCPAEITIHRLRSAAT